MRLPHRLCTNTCTTSIIHFLHLQCIYRPPASLYLSLVSISSTFSTVAISLSWPKRLYFSLIKGLASSYAWSNSLATSVKPD